MMAGIFMQKFITNLEQLLLGTKPINQDGDTPSDGDHLIYDAADGDWKIKSAAVKATTATKVMQANISGDIATDGTTWVDITWEVPTRMDTDAFSVDSASIWNELTLERADEGDYIFWVTLTSDFNSNNQYMYVALFLWNGSTWEELQRSEREQHTSSAEGCQIILSGYSDAFNDGDQVKVMAKFSTSDAGSDWLADKCNIYVQFVPD